MAGARGAGTAAGWTRDTPRADARQPVTLMTMSRSRTNERAIIVTFLSIAVLGPPRRWMVFRSSLCGVAPR